MTVADNKPVSGPFFTNGVIADFPFTFKVFEGNQVRLRVENLDGSGGYEIEDGLSVEPQYLNSDVGGYVSLAGAPLPAGLRVFSFRDTVLSQPIRLGNQGRFFPEIHEQAFDLLEMQIQETRDTVDLALRLSVNPSGIGVVIRSSPGSVLGWDEDGNITNLLPSEIIFGAGLATAAQGAKADTAMQFEDLRLGALQGVELGRDLTGSRITYLDFHTQDDAPDYNARIAASGGEVSGRAVLDFTASRYRFNGADTLIDSGGGFYSELGDMPVLFRIDPGDVALPLRLQAALYIHKVTKSQNNHEFMAAFALDAYTGLAAALAGQYGGDKVALFAEVNAYLGSGSTWSGNSIVTVKAGNVSDGISHFNWEMDCNNQGKHYGDDAVVSALGNYYGILLTGVGSYRKSAAIVITDVVNGAWNNGIVFLPGAISTTGSSFKDMASGHTAAFDALGTPIFGVRQASDGSRNWFNGKTLIGDYADAQAQSRLHVEGGAIGGAPGSIIEVLRRGSLVDTTRMWLREFVIRASATTGPNSIVYRQGFFAGSTLASYIQWKADGSVAFQHGMAENLSLNLTVDGDVLLGRRLGFDPAKNAVYASPAEASAAIGANRVYRRPDNTLGWT